MFDNLPKEVILFSMIPVIVIVVVDLIAFLFMIKKEKGFKFNYFIKISLLVANAFVLPLIGGYTIWTILKFINKGVLENNILYVALLIFLWIVLFILFIWVYMKARRELKSDEQLEVEENNEYEESQDE